MKFDRFSADCQQGAGAPTARHLVPALVAALGLLALGASTLRATPVYAGLGFGVSAAQGTSSSSIVYGSDHASWGTVGSPLSVSTSATSGGVTAFGSETATWASDGNSGTIVADYGWSFRAPPGPDGVGTGEGGPNWEYSFIADATGNFVLNYNVTGTGDTLFGLQGFRIGEHEYFNLGYALVDDTHPSGLGQYVYAVTAGNSYDFQFVNLGNINGTIQTLDASLHGEFSWTLPGAEVASVPEVSSSVVLLGLGLGGLGLTRRWVRQSAIQ